MSNSHKNYSIQVENNLIILTLIGEFCELSVQAYATEVQSIIKSFKNKPFLMLVDNLALVGATPQAYEESNQHNQWLSSTNILGKATVYPSTFLSDIDSSRVTSKKLLNCKNFDSIKTAKEWLNSLSQ